VSLARLAFPSPNFSSRGGAGVRLIVLHTAEGARTIESLGAYFADPSAEVSSHAGIDDKAGTIGVYVKRGDKAWTAANANPYAVQAELCGFAAWSTAEWDGHPAMLENAAAWVAEEAAAFGIPILRLSAAQAQGGAAGVCQHVDLGSAGGGHSDCGDGFPMDRVLSMAGGAPAAPSPPAGGAPPWPGRYLELGDPMMAGDDVRTWQGQMLARGWALEVDGIYGPQSADVCRSFQAEKGLGVDGIVGPETWAATWAAPIT
jgi:putative peptidoglycan binding protein/N-acetylmuramoyl-L-alanine amidase-like protein